MTKSNILLLGDGHASDAMSSWFEIQGDLVTRLTLTQPIELENISAANVIIDVNTKLSEKLATWQAIQHHVDSEMTMFTSCTATCVTQVASFVGNRISVAGFNPWAIPSLDVLEISRPLQEENDNKWETLLKFWAERGKHIEVVDDTPGLVFPRILSLIVNEAAFALVEGVATAEDIDSAMKYGTNYPSGPLAWADEIGVDEILAVLQGLYDEFGEDRYRPAFYLKKLVHAGWTGKKAGRGFYRYADEQVSRFGDSING